jgi:hypothetical protein
LFTEGSLELRGAPICRTLFARSPPGPTRVDAWARCLTSTVRPTRGGPEPACRPSSGGRYAAGMSEYRLDGLVNQFAVVLTAMTETESLLRDRVRAVRLGTPSQPGVAEVAPSAPAPFSTGSVMPEPATAPGRAVPTAQGGEAAPARMSAPVPATRPESSQAEPASPVTGHRNYDYFSELDEKLTGLRQRYLE